MVGIDRRQQGRRDQGALPEERGHEAVRRTPVEIARRADLEQLAVPQDGDPVGHRQRFFLVVGHVEDGCPRLAVDAPDLLLHPDAQRPIERSQRLVHQQQRRLERERPGDRHPLLLTAGELARIALAVAVQLDQRQHLLHPATAIVQATSAAA